MAKVVELLLRGPHLRRKISSRSRWRAIYSGNRNHRPCPPHLGVLARPNLPPLRVLHPSVAPNRCRAPPPRSSPSTTSASRNPMSSSTTPNRPAHPSPCKRPPGSASRECPCSRGVAPAPAPSRTAPRRTQADRYFPASRATSSWVAASPRKMRCLAPQTWPN